MKIVDEVNIVNKVLLINKLSLFENILKLRALIVSIMMLVTYKYVGMYVLNSDLRNLLVKR